MGEWISIPNFSDGSVVRARNLRDIINNLDHLHEKNFDQTLPFEGDGLLQGTTSSTLIKITGVKYTLEIDTEGGDVWVEANLFTSIDVFNTNMRIGWALMVDGVLHNGITTSQENILRSYEEEFEQFMGLTWVLTGLAAGSHTLELYARRANGSTTIRFRNAMRDYLWALEF